MLEIYELYKVHNKITKYSQTLALTIIIHQTNNQYPNYNPANFLKMCPRAQRTLLALNRKKILGRTFFKL